MNKNAELRSALLYFVDEALGFRKSLHHFQRWLETEEQGELQALIIEIGTENSIDFNVLLNNIEAGNTTNCLQILKDRLAIGLYQPKIWAKLNSTNRLLPLVNCPINNAGSLVENISTLWEFRSWIESHTEFGALNTLLYSYQTLLDAKQDNIQLIRLIEMFLGYNTLCSCVLDNDITLLANTIAMYYPDDKKEFIINLGKTIKHNPDLNWKDALSRNQIISKVWLLDKLKLVNNKSMLRSIESDTILVGGWVGILPLLASINNVNLGSVVNVDLDATVHRAAATLNIASPGFQSAAEDIKTFDFSKYNAPLIIDTIVEHFENHGEWVKTLPKDSLIVLQGNNMFDVPDHVNCHKSIDEFVQKCGLSNILWYGQSILYKCTRFMAIGYV